MTKEQMHTMSIVETSVAVVPADVPAESMRSSTVHMLNHVLAHTLDLGLQARRVYWNLIDPRFATIRELLREFVGHLDTNADRIANRVVQLKGVAEGSLRVIEGRSILAPERASERGFTIGSLTFLLAALSSAAALARHAMCEVSLQDDAGSVEVLTEISFGLDKWLWCLEVHLESAGASSSV
jgi:starvation-inducible DNA-binding protein